MTHGPLANFTQQRPFLEGPIHQHSDALGFRQRQQAILRVRKPERQRQLHEVISSDLMISSSCPKAATWECVTR
jgi:hypothetical protein